VTAFRVLVTGSRDWTDDRAIFGALDAASGRARVLKLPMVVVHGAARGADSVANGWAVLRQRAGFPIVPEPHPADWARPVARLDIAVTLKWWRWARTCASHSFSTSRRARPAARSWPSGLGSQPCDLSCR